MRVLSLEEMLGAGSNSMEHPQPLPHPDAQKMELAALARRYTAGLDRVQLGDWVMPVASCHLIGHGQPHLVVKAQERVHTFDKSHPGSAEYGTPINMMVACYDRNGCTSLYWTDSCWFEPYVAPIS